MHGCQQSACAASEFARYMYALSMVYAFTVLQVALLASATAGVALLTLLVSHHMAIQCMSIIEVIKLSG